MAILSNFGAKNNLRSLGASTVLHHQMWKLPSVGRMKITEVGCANGDSSICSDVDTTFR